MHLDLSKKNEDWSQLRWEQREFLDIFQVPWNRARTKSRRWRKPEQGKPSGCWMLLYVTYIHLHHLTSCNLPDVIFHFSWFNISDYLEDAMSSCPVLIFFPWCLCLCLMCGKPSNRFRDGSTAGSIQIFGKRALNWSSQRIRIKNQERGYQVGISSSSK